MRKLNLVFVLVSLGTARQYRSVVAAELRRLAAFTFTSS